MSPRAILDSPSPAALLEHRGALRRAEGLVVYASPDRTWDRLRLWSARLAARLFLGRGVEVRRIRPWMRYAHNPEAVRRLEDHPRAFNRGLLGALAGHLGASEADILKFAKGSLTERLATQIYIREQARCEGGGSGVLLVATEPDRFGVYSGLTGVLPSQGARLFLWRAARLLAAGLATAGVLFHRLFRTRLLPRQPAPLRTELLVQAVHFGNEDGIEREFGSEDYVFDPERVALFISDIWRPSEALLKAFVSRLRARGIRWVDERDFAAGPALALRLGAAALGLYRRAWRELRSWEDLDLYARFLKALLQEEMVLGNCSVRAVLCMDDYAPWHVARTLLCRQRGVRSFGVQHSAANGFHGVPNLAYVCFDRYLIFGRFFRELFHPFWDDQPLVEFSYNRIDALLRRLKNGGAPPPALPRTRGKKNILVTLPSTSRIEEFFAMFPNGPGMLEFLRMLDDEVFERSRVFVRPKYAPGIEELRQRVANERVEFILGGERTTTELLASADLVIASNGSGILMECALLRVPALNYDYFGFLNKYWLKYGADMCSSSARELDSRVKAYLRGEPLDVRWESLWSDMAYPNEGETWRVLERLLESPS